MNLTLENVIAGAIIIVVLLAIFFFPKEIKALAKGSLRIFIKDMATTPEGAEALYEDEIEKAQKSYNIANDAYKEASGNLSLAKKSLEKYKERLAEVEKECERFVINDKMEMAQLKSDEREEIRSDIKRCEAKVKVYEDATAKAKSAQEICEKNLRKLKRESKEVVENMRVNAELQSVYNNMEELGSLTGTTRLLEDVKEKNKSLEAIVEGSKVAYENKISTKLEKAEKEAQRLKSNDYLESLKKKHNK